ncbi:hypothetical protein FOZ61_009402 [Perkinsus olseni]|uniref:Uncharacterized protein n=1 Tax=Perkinsus olseni TaxID=32597 RepID=A0A7J6KZN0_PEROL|nr:hypothetical protein FOZ61_009402 [Perkinsus olseni]KAF4654681.1 hypothetical protein FOL46_008640 [Perkinsus olseni]
MVTSRPPVSTAAALPSAREVALAMCSEDDMALSNIHAEFRAVQESTGFLMDSGVSWMGTLSEALVRNAISGMRGGGLPERVGPREVQRVLSPSVLVEGDLSDAAEANLVLVIRLLARTKDAGRTAAHTIIPLAKVCSKPLSERALKLSREVKHLLPLEHRREIAGAISALQIGVYMQDAGVVGALLKVHDDAMSVVTEGDMAVAHFCVLKFATPRSRELLDTLRGLSSTEVAQTGEFIAEFLFALDFTNYLKTEKLLSLLDGEMVNLKARAPMLEYADYLPAGASVAHLLLVCFDRGIEGVCEVLPHLMSHWQAQLALQQDLGPVDVQCLDLVGSAPLLRSLQPLRPIAGVGEGASCLVDELIKFGARRSCTIMGLYRHLASRVRAQPTRCMCRCRVCSRWMTLTPDVEPLVWVNLARIAEGEDEVSRAEWMKYDRSQQLNELLVYRPDGTDDDEILKEMKRLLEEGADPNIPLEGRWASVEGLFPIHSCTSPMQVKLLHRSGADMNALCQGQTAADIALIRGDQETCRCLLLLGTSLTSTGVRRLLSMPRERALAMYPSRHLLPNGTGWPRKIEVLSERAHAAEDALYKLGGLFSNLDERRGSETRELHSNIESLENVVEVKREQLSALEKDVDEENNAARQGRLLARYRRKLACRCGAKVQYATVDCGHGLCENCRCKAGARCPECGQAIPKGFVQLSFLHSNT